MFKLHILVIAFIFSLFIAGCNEKSGMIIPLKENSSFGYINEAPREETDTLSVNILSYKKSDIYDYVILSSNPYFGRKDEELSLKVNTETGEILSDANGKENILIPEMKKLKKGYTWNYTEWDAVISSENEIVKTRKQVFENCLRIDYRLSMTLNAEIWIKPGVGIVRFSAYRTNPPSLSPTYYVLNK